MICAPEELITRLSDLLGQVAAFEEVVHGPAAGDVQNGPRYFLTACPSFNALNPPVSPKFV